MKSIIPHEGVLWDDGTNPEAVVPNGYSTGLRPRDFTRTPVGSMAAAPAFPDSLLLPEDQWADRWNEKMKNRSSLLHYREDYFDVLQSLDQDGYPLCWAFSSTKLAMYLRKLLGLPPLRLSGWWTGGQASGWRSRGGYGEESITALSEVGPCTLDECPSYSSRYDTPENKTKAASRKILAFYDGAEDSSLAQKQAISALLRDMPCVIDLNVMSHSMCCIWFTLNPITFIYDNSWGGSGDKGLYKGSGAYARPNGLWIGRDVRAV